MISVQFFLNTEERRNCEAVDALLEIYRKMRPGDPPTVQTAYKLLEAMFFDPRKFDFSRVAA